MISIREAEAIAKQYSTDFQEKIGNPVQITKIQQESVDWVFFYQSKDYSQQDSQNEMGSY